MATRESILQYAADVWGDAPDFPFSGDAVSAVLRHAANRKWYALLMRVADRHLALPSEGETDVLNLKIDPLLAAPLYHRHGFLPAYHMNKEKWITILLDGSVPMRDVAPLLEMSHAMTDTKMRRRLRC